MITSVLSKDHIIAKKGAETIPRLAYFYNLKLHIKCCNTAEHHKEMKNKLIKGINSLVQAFLLLLFWGLRGIQPTDERELYQKLFTDSLII
jgi:hypothetical protein